MQARMVLSLQFLLFSLSKTVGQTSNGCLKENTNVPYLETACNSDLASWQMINTDVG